MCATPSTTQLDRSLVDAQFGELICADQELLRAEFDAIVAAEWPAQPPGINQPPDQPPHWARGPRPVSAAPDTAGRRLPRGRRAAAASRRRPRSPPGAA